ncbi:MAG: beta-galactosidase trimerization domain-containing protein, partial [Firmicutes bacterium]|nr:beta-galactosidase trimerization domain-containing protein [Bacillota bacterium]
YPRPDTTPARIALNHEMIRSLKHGDPFILMEQTPSVTNWQPYNALKRPGVMALQSYQAIAHGADSVMFFQMRRNVAGFEKFHGAIIDHSCTEHTRTFREVAALGAQLAHLGGRTLGSRTPSQVGVLFDWENWWAVEYSSGHTSHLSYLDEVERYYTGLYSRNFSTDVVGPEGDFGKYRVIVAPMLYMLRPGLDEKLRQFVRSGGTLVVSYLSGYVDENDLITLGGYPGKLRDILGIWVEETDALPEGGANHFLWNGARYAAKRLCDLLHCEGARSLAVYQEDFYAGMPVVTENAFGQGKAYYVAAQSDPAFYADFLDTLCREQGIRPVMQTPDGVEAAIRVGDGKAWVFLLNHTRQAQTVTADADAMEILTDTPIRQGQTLALEPAGVLLLEKALG